MQPLPQRTRRLYLYVFVALFMAVLPVVILYADGWRFRQGHGFVRTGGIFIAVPYPGAHVYVGDIEVGRSGFLERSFYIDNLAPSAYMVRVEAENYATWSRMLIVEEQLVTDARVFLIPTKITSIELTTRSPVLDQRQISTETYAEYVQSFATTTGTLASSTLPVEESEGIGLFIIDGDVSVRWMREGALSPSVFCGRPSFCVTDIPVERGDEDVISARLFKGGVVYLTKTGLYFSEIDARPSPLVASLYSGAGIDFRVIGDALLVQDGERIFEVEGL